MRLCQGWTGLDRASLDPRRSGSLGAPSSAPCATLSPPPQALWTPLNKTTGQGPSGVEAWRLPPTVTGARGRLTAASLPRGHALRCLLSEPEELLHLLGLVPSAYSRIPGAARPSRVKAKVNYYHIVKERCVYLHQRLAPALCSLQFPREVLASGHCLTTDAEERRALGELGSSCLKGVQESPSAATGPWHAPGGRRLWSTFLFK